MYQQGDIILVNFPLPKGFKLHPAVVISVSEVYESEESYICAMISSVQINDNFVPAGGSTLSLAKNNVNYAMNLSSVTKPNVNKYSGEILYIDNRVKFAPSESQTIVASTLITF